MFRKITPFAALLAAFIATGTAMADVPPPVPAYIPPVATPCDTTEQDLLDLIKEDPSRLVVKMEGQQINDFINYLIGKGWFGGTVKRIDSIYVVTAKLRPGFTEPHVWLFFIMDGCLAAKVPAQRSAVEPGFPK